MPHFFVQPEDIDLTQQEITLSSEEDIKHITKILRYRIGDCIKITDGLGTVYDSRIKSIQKNELICIYENFINQNRQGKNPDITLAYGVIKNKNEDLIIQKCTEIGANQFIPIRMEFSNKHEQYTSERFLRLRKIAYEACKQSERLFIPHIHAPIDFFDIPNLLAGYHHLFVCMERHEATQSRISFIGNRILIIVGPEGGFSLEEKKHMEHLSIPKLSLGSTILRAETASISACSIISDHYRNQF